MHSTLLISSHFPISSPIKGGIIPILEVRKLDLYKEKIKSFLPLTCYGKVI